MASALSQPIRTASQQQVRYPVPVGGLNFRASLLNGAPTDAIVLDNFIARPFGLEIRRGWRYWIPEANRFPNEVKTIIPFVGKASANSRLFCSTSISAGLVYNITTQNAPPVLSLTPSTTPVSPGEWYHTMYSTPGGNFLCMVCAGAGYYVYSSAGSWVEYVTGSGAGKIEFPAGDTTTTKQFTFCWVWKNRLWFLKDDSSTAYYLPVSSISGKVAPFDLGPQMIHGGALNFATSWTYDSGKGMDDGLIFASNEGDVMVYEGTDPSSAADFSLKGTWYVGRFPVGRRCFTAQGGDVLILTEYGLLKMSDLVSGRIAQAGLGGGDDPLYKLNPRLARLITRAVSEYYWFLLPYPTEELLIVGAPFVNQVSGLRQSFVMNAIMNSWSTTTNLDMLCGELYFGQLICGTRTGEVIQPFYGYADKVSADGLDPGSSVIARLQTSYQGFGDDLMNKRALRIKLYGMTDGTPTVAVKLIPEYNVNDTVSVSGPVTDPLGAWDTGLWDQALWAGTQIPLRRWLGVSGYGKRLSMLMAIRSQGYLLLSDYETLFETGNNL